VAVAVDRSPRSVHDELEDPGTDGFRVTSLEPGRWPIGP
jgi:hypothetical protein